MRVTTYTNNTYNGATIRKTDEKMFLLEFYNKNKTLQIHLSESSGYRVYRELKKALKLT